MFRSYDHHQAEKYIATLGLLNWQRIRRFIISYIIVIAYILLCIVLILRCYGRRFFFGVYYVVLDISIIPSRPTRFITLMTMEGH
jgi:hypothetical protein